MTILILLMWLGVAAITCVGIAWACGIFEVASNYLGRNMNEGSKGATIVAIASSMPEMLSVSFFLYFANANEVGTGLAAGISAAAGSAVFNSIIIPIMIILFALIAKSIITVGGRNASMSKRVIARDGLWLLLAELMLIIVLSSKFIGITHGLILISFYVAYAVYTVRSSSSSNGPKMSKIAYMETIKLNYWTNLVFGHMGKGATQRALAILSSSVLIIAIMCAALVHATEQISVLLDINMIYIAMFLVASASSVPEVVMSVREARNGNVDDAMSNVLGSNIFDITISIGLPLTVYCLFTGGPIDFTAAGTELVDLRVVLFIVTAATIAIYYFSKKLGVLQIILLSGLYITFALYCIGGAYPESTLGEVVNAIQHYLNNTVGVTILSINKSLGL